MESKKLLIIYKDSKLSSEINKLGGIFNILFIKKRKNISWFNYKKEGNKLVYVYNNILFNDDSEEIFFLASSEITNSVIHSLLDFKKGEDFGFFKNPTDKTLKFLSGFFVKREVLLRTGFFDRYIFYNLYLNFLINYSRFISPITRYEYIQPLKLKSNTPLSYFDEAFYLNQILYSEYYQKFLPKLQNQFLTLIAERFVRRNTFCEYY